VGRGRGSLVVRDVIVRAGSVEAGRDGRWRAVVGVPSSSRESSSAYQIPLPRRHNLNLFLYVGIDIRANQRRDLS
jgi:hypothetical protein